MVKHSHLTLNLKQSLLNKHNLTITGKLPGRLLSPKGELVTFQEIERIGGKILVQREKL